MEVTGYYAKYPTTKDPDRDKFAWYVFPFANGSSPYYTLNQKQEAEVAQCKDTFYFHKAASNFDWVLMANDGYYVGYEEGTWCVYPLQNYGNFNRFSKNRTGPNCHCDEMGNCYYDPRCRPWYINSKKIPNRMSFEDLYLYSGGSAAGLTICAPVKN